MPEPPSSSLITRYVFENPWPVGILTLIVAALMIWTGLRDATWRRVQVAIGIGAFGLIVLLIGYLVTTAGERASSVTRALVEAMVAGDRVGATDLFANDAILSVGSPQNPGMGYDSIVEAIDDWCSRYKVESNTITSLRGYSEDSHSGEAHLGCRTTVAEFPYPNTSQWVVRARRQDDGEWKIVQIACMAINGRTPSANRLVR
jgi:hypothetical protein